MTKNALIISFFISNNVGDIALSKAIEERVKNMNMNIEKMDFVTSTKIKNDYVIKENIVNNPHHNPSKPLNKANAKKFFRKFLSESQTEKIILQIQLTKQNKKKDVENSIKNSDVLIIGGGNMIMDISPNWPYIFNYYINLAKKYNKSVYVPYVGMGPLKSADSIKTFKSAFRKIDFLSVRDDISKEIAIELLNYNHPVSTIDPVFSFSKNMGEREVNKKNIGVCILSEQCFITTLDYVKYIYILETTIKKLSEKNVNLNFFFFSTETSDYSSVWKVYNSFKSDNNLTINVKEIYSTKDVVSLYNDLDFLIGGRMHSLIFSQVMLVPYIGFIWQNKLQGFSLITNSQNELFSIESSNTDDIVTTILNNIGSDSKIARMKKLNESLYEQVEQGLPDDTI